MVFWEGMRDSKGHEVALWVMDRSTVIVMVLVLVPWVYTYWKTSQIVHIKYVQLLHDNYISTKHLNKLLHIKIWSPIHFRKLDLATLHWLPSLSWQQKWLAMWQMLHPWSTGSTFSQPPFSCQCSNGCGTNNAETLSTHKTFRFLLCQWPES